jgi:hypothetical protein
MQYALLGDGNLRHLPNGVDEYLKLRALSLGASRGATEGRGGRADIGREVHRRTIERDQPPAAGSAVAPSGAERRELEKKLKGVERSLEKIAVDETELHANMATHDQADYDGLSKLAQAQADLNAKREQFELEWLELTETLG